MGKFSLRPALLRVRTGIFLPACLMMIFGVFSQCLKAQDQKPLDRRISFKVDKSSLLDALNLLGEKSGLLMNFNMEEVKTQSQQVSISVSNETVRTILTRLLEHTGLQFTEVDNGDVVLSPRKSKKEPEKKELWYMLSGGVTDNKGRPLPNASVTVIDQKWGATADEKGLFRILATNGCKIRVSFLGMKTEERTVRSNSFIKIALDTAPSQIKEYVVTGYQTVDKRMLASSTFTLKPEDFLQNGVPSVDQMLQGKVPGLVVVNNSGSPSATPTLRIRGTSTFLGNAAPLWVVDGVIKEDPVDLNPLQVNEAISGAQNANFSIVGNAIAGLNPYDIESITFLKDASATAIYGIRAAGGVIVVTTKRGKAGRTQTNYSVNTGFTSRPSYDHLYLMDSKDRVGVSEEMEDRGLFYATTPLPASYEGLLSQLYNRTITQAQFTQQVMQLETMNTDWFKLLCQNTLSENHSLSFSGGAGKTLFFSSFSYGNDNGTMKGDNLKRYTARINLQTALNNKMDFNVDLYGSYRIAQGFFQVNPLDYALMTSRAISADSPYIATIAPGNRSGYSQQILHYDIFNELAQTSNTSGTKQITLATGLNYRILPGLKYSGNFSADASGTAAFCYATEHSYYVANIRGYDYGTVANGSPAQLASRLPFGGIAFPNNSDVMTYDLRNTLDYSHNFFSGRDQLSLMMGQEIRSIKNTGFESQELGYYPDRGDTYYSSFYDATGSWTNSNNEHYAQTINTVQNTLSWVFIASYRLKKRYVFNFNARTDGSNRFGQYTNQRFLPNWSIAGRWDISEEPWMTKCRAINMLSLRGSFGTQGTVVSDVGPNMIVSYPGSPVDPVSGEFILNLQSLPYPDLRWEKTYASNIGVDLALFDGRIRLTTDVYYKTSKDLLTNINIPEEYGIPNMVENYGGVTNTGADASLNVTPVKTRDFSWSQSFAYSYNSNQVAQNNMLYTWANYINGSAIVPGKALGSFWSFKYSGLNHVYGYPEYDLKNYTSTSSDPTTYLGYFGRMTPIIQTGTSTMIRYKEFTINAGFVVSLGNQKRQNPIYATGTLGGGVPPELNLPKILDNRWRKPGDEKTTNIPGFSNWYADGDAAVGGITDFETPYAAYDLSTARVLNAGYLRCQSISASYTVPVRYYKNLGIHGMSVTASVNNPFVIKGRQWQGQDPEIQGSGGTALPIIPAWYMALNISF